MLPATNLLHCGSTGLHLVQSLGPALCTASQSSLGNHALRRVFTTAAASAAAHLQLADSLPSGFDAFASLSRLSPPNELSVGDPETPHHSPQRFLHVLSPVRSTYPETMWAKLANLFGEQGQQPVAVDIAVGSEGRPGVELARRGFHVMSVGCGTAALQETLACAVANRAQLEVVSAHAEHDVVRPESADLVTCMHGMHLLNCEQVLPEAHRILRQGGKLVVAWNDRDLSSPFIAGLEQALERHMPGYTHSDPSHQHYIHAWTPLLQHRGLFRLAEYHEHSNPVVLEGAEALAEIVECHGFVRHNLHGEQRQALLSDVRALARQHYGSGPVLLPLLTRAFELDKASPTYVTLQELLQRRQQAKRARKQASTKRLGVINT